MSLAAPHRGRPASTLPTAETGVAELLRDAPEADGRGTCIAVLDTGCDLAAAGLRTTSDGKPKYLDFIDATGGGDVDTSKVVERAADGTVVGASGRTLALGAWADTADEIRVGAVRLYDLLPTSVLERIKRERKTAFLVQQHVAVTAAQRSLAALSAGEKGHDDAEALLAELKKLMDAYEDAGPLLDVVLLRVGGAASPRWRAVVGEGNLEDAEPLAPYREKHQYSDFGYGTALSFCLQVYDGGAITSLVTDAGSHGTHVAGIAAAYFPDALERNGVAPGAQVLAIKIGDGRLGSAETGTGLVRALIAAKELGCDIINLSYGEPFLQAEAGRTSDTFTAAVRKWGLTIFTSAGNDGPALSTVNAPGCLTAPITVGAYISPAMMEDQYSMLAPSVGYASPPDTSYSFSSRGPTPDGWLPTICAPGGAVAPVPRHTLQGRAQYHGTSMSSPNAAGVAACVMSALRQAGIDIGPAEFRRALENSAQPIAGNRDPFSQGFGLINAPAAVAYAKEHHGKLGQDVAFRVTLPARANARGLYLRDQAELSTPTTFTVKVEPQFDHAHVRSDAEMQEVLGLDLDLALAADAPWVETPASFVLTSGLDRGGQTFSVRVDASSLAPGAYHARVMATDALDPARGPLFTLPITVIVPHEAGLAHLALPAGEPVRRFLAVPDTAEWAVLKISTSELPGGPHSVILHAVPAARGDVPHTWVATKKFLALHENSLLHVPVKLKGGSTLEVCLQLSWLANPNALELDLDVEFHSYGLRGAALATDRPLRISAADSFARLEVSPPLRSERVRLDAELVRVERTLRPQQHKIRAGSAERDVLPVSDAERMHGAPATPGTQIHEMVLTYDFEISLDKGEETRSVIPHVKALHDQLYDSPVDSMLWRLEDAVTGAVRGYGGAIHEAKPIKLRKGKYKVSLLLRHPEPSQLEALKHLPLLLKMELAKPLGCKVYGDRGTAIAAGKDDKPFPASWLRKGAHRSLYVTPPRKLPSWISPGDSLTGLLLIDKEAKDVTAVALAYEAPPQAIEKKKALEDSSVATNGTETEEEKEAQAKEEDEDALSKVLLEAKLGRLRSLRTSNASEERYTNLSSALLAEHPNHLPLLLEMLAWARRGDAAARATRADAIIAASDAILAPGGPVDTARLAQYYGVASVPEDDSAATKKKQAKEKQDREEERRALRIALTAKAAALAPVDWEIAVDNNEEPSKFAAAVRAMKQWVTKTDDLDDKMISGPFCDEYALTLAKFELKQGKPGAALSLLHGRLKAEPAKPVAEAVAALYASLGWVHWARNAAERLEKDYPRTQLLL